MRFNFEVFDLLKCSTSERTKQCMSFSFDMIFLRVAVHGRCRWVRLLNIPQHRKPGWFPNESQTYGGLRGEAVRGSLHGEHRREGEGRQRREHVRALENVEAAEVIEEVSTVTRGDVCARRRYLL